MAVFYQLILFYNKKLILAKFRKLFRDSRV